MSKMSKAVKENSLRTTRKNETVVNFMGGISYLTNPLTTLKMISASSIFGEPSYYRDSGFDASKKYNPSNIISKYIMIDDASGKTTTDIFVDAIDKALTYDFVGTVKWAVELRNEYNIRLNPQIIMVRAALHPDRKNYTENGFDFRSYEKQVMRRGDESLTQMAYYLYLNKDKNGIPSILKRSWADHLSSLNRYTVNKYKNSEIGMINGVRICHAHSDVINTLMRKGDVPVPEKEKTWEQMRSSGKSWKYIIKNCNLGHMAMLRNIRNIFTEIDDVGILDEFVDKLKDGVLSGKQFPFRYYTAYQQLKNCNNLYHKDILLNALEDCIDISINNMPKLKGRTICLTDNSGSAWGTIPSEYGTVKVAEIDNLSSIITAKRSEEGYVAVFGDNLKIVRISKNDKVLKKLNEINDIGHGIGMGTEGGIWKFFYKAINNSDKYDNIFIYSDMQAGVGGLYGTALDLEQYRSEFSCRGRFIDCFKLTLKYRNVVNPNVNVFSVQTAGYNNSVIPDMTYRCDLLYGWTGRELVYADMKIKLWNQMSGK